MKPLNFRLIFFFILIFFNNPATATPLLVDVKWLSNHHTDDDIILVDMSDAMQYQRFHIPNAIHLPYSALNQRNRQNISFSIGQDNFIKLLSFIGIKAKQHVVIYDDMAGLHASRLYWELERIGHKRVSILNGGSVSWILAGYKVNNVSIPYTKTNYLPASKALKNTLAQLADVSPKQPHGNTVLLDVRSKEEYFGHAKQLRSGHIPGAKWWPWQQAVDFKHGFVQQNNKHLQQSLAAIGIKDKNTDLIVYCQSGHRASQTYMTLKNLGYKRVRLYDGSMAEYASNKNLPLVTGAAAK